MSRLARAYPRRYEGAGTRIGVTRLTGLSTIQSELVGGLRAPRIKSLVRCPFGRLRWTLAPQHGSEQKHVALTHFFVAQLGRVEAGRW